VLNYAAQVILFAATTIAWARLVRTLPRLRVPGARRWTLLLAAIAAVAGPLAIALLGHDLDDEGPIPALWTATSAAFLALSVAVLWVARRADPARGRRRCPRCWYDMSAAPSLTCPECGHTARDARRLLATRRSTRLALLATLPVTLSYASMKLPRVEEFGYGIFIPTLPLILGFEWLPETVIIDDADEHEWDLHDRWVAEDLWPWQLELLDWRARRIVSRSTRFERLKRASSLVQETLSERMSDEAAVNFVRGNIAGAHGADLFQIMPAILGEPAQREIADIVREALANGDERTASDASMYVAHAPRHAVELTDALAARMELAEPRFLTMATFVLADRADKDQRAWEIFRRNMEQGSLPVRRLAVRLASLVKSRHDQVLPLLDAAIADSDDTVALNASKALARIDGALPPRRAALLSVASQRPAIAADIIFTLCAAQLHGPEVFAIARTTLAGDDARQISTILFAIERLGPDAASLRPDLDTLAARPIAAEVANELKDAIDAIDHPIDAQ
jgi:hypothetical protein